VIWATCRRGWSGRRSSARCAFDDLYLAGIRRLGDWDAQGQHAGVLAGHEALPSSVSPRNSWRVNAPCRRSAAITSSPSWRRAAALEPCSGPYAPPESARSRADCLGGRTEPRRNRAAGGYALSGSRPLPPCAQIWRISVINSRDDCVTASRRAATTTLALLLDRHGPGSGRLLAAFPLLRGSPTTGKALARSPNNWIEQAARSRRQRGYRLSGLVV
jgi:hypothetical protein